jgi:hypothetical protein
VEIIMSFTTLLEQVEWEYATIDGVIAELTETVSGYSEQLETLKAGALTAENLVQIETLKQQISVNQAALNSAIHQRLEMVRNGTKSLWDSTTTTLYLS